VGAVADVRGRVDVAARTTSTIGRPNFLAKAQSRSSCAGQANTAPVP
jgi:hypothetical protein